MGGDACPSTTWGPVWLRGRRVEHLFRMPHYDGEAMERSPMRKRNLSEALTLLANAALIIGVLIALVLRLL